MRLWAALLVALIALLSSSARAEEGDARARAEALFAEAVRADEALRFAAALEGYEAARALDPGSRHAARAEARAAFLRARAEGGFAPLARLERVRRDPAQGSDPRAIDALVADAEGFPPGPVRVEARVLAAEAYARRLGRPDDALHLLAEVVADPHADPVLARQAAREQVTLLVARGELEAARVAVRAAGDRADPSLARDVARLLRRGRLRAGALALLAIVLALVGRAALLAARRRALGAVAPALRKIAPAAAVFVAWVALAGAALAASYEDGNARPFLFFGAALLPLALVARAWGAVGAPTRAARAARGVLCGASALAVAFLVLERVDAAYLEGLGL